MNKLIIAGNGFDLAHGLPTSYNHFMDAFWRDLKDDYEDELVKKMVYFNKKFIGYLKVQSFSNYEEFKKKNTLRDHDFRFNNQFFKQLNEIQSIQNWVDVENEYYNNLKKIIKEKYVVGRPLVTKESKKSKLKKLHKEFEQVKQLLERYLQKNVNEFYDLSYDQGNKKNDFQKNRRKISSVLLPSGPLDLGSTLVLNFNYTSTFDFYIRELGFVAKLDVKVNQIHGKLNEDTVFGFGDEMDDDYKLIENMDDNEYLKYFKSFQYVQNSNYKDVLRYVDSGRFQVVITGHSCGLSDRTLLNTIFEHDNCRSIKVFYHQKDDGTDNYTEVVQNISRHFKDKKLMRTKIVEKTLCEPMPQIELPKKE